MFSQLVPDVSNVYCKTMKGRKFEPSFISDRLSVSADTCYRLSVTAVIGEPFSHHGKIYCTELNYSSLIQLYTSNPFIHTLGEHHIPSLDAPPLCTLASCQLVSNANWIWDQGSISKLIFTYLSERDLTSNEWEHAERLSLLRNSQHVYNAFSNVTWWLMFVIWVEVKSEIVHIFGSAKNGLATLNTLLATRN